MIILGFGRWEDELSADEEQYRAETMAQAMKAVLEEHGWYSSFGRDPVLILIEDEEINQNGEPE